MRPAAPCGRGSTVNPDHSIGVQHPAYQRQIVKLHLRQGVWAVRGEAERHEGIRVTQMIDREQGRPLARVVLQALHFGLRTDPHCQPEHPLHQPAESTTSRAELHQARQLGRCTSARGFSCSGLVILLPRLLLQQPASYFTRSNTWSASRPSEIDDHGIFSRSQGRHLTG